MDQTRHLVFAFAFHRNDVTALTDGYNGLPQVFGISRRRNHFLQALPNPCALLTHMAANIR